MFYTSIYAHRQGQGGATIRKRLHLGGRLVALRRRCRRAFLRRIWTFLIGRREERTFGSRLVSRILGQSLALFGVVLDPAMENEMKARGVGR